MGGKGRALVRSKRGGEGGGGGGGETAEGASTG